MNFAIIGVAGYIAPRHLKAIKDTGNVLIAALDKNDNVGIIDNYFPDADFFTEPERFDRHLDKLKRMSAQKVDYVSICTPNYLHDAHIRLAVRNDAHVICEKPVVLNPWNVEALINLENETNKNIYTILQLRYHDSIINLKKKIEENNNDKKWNVDVTYITSRGKWFSYSWKADLLKSGGIATNIGIHFFDMLLWLFGDLQSNTVHLSAPNKAAGIIELKKARVRWFLSTDITDLPKKSIEKGQRTYRLITVENEEIEFSEGFTDLHTVSYREILSGRGFRVSETINSITLVQQIRNAAVVFPKGDYHPFIKKYY